MGTMVSTCIWGQMGIIYIYPNASIYAGMTEDRDKNKFNLRLPDGMREHIADIAKANSRSMNSEIVARLSEFDELQARVAEAERLMDYYKRDVDELRAEGDRLRANQATDRATATQPLTIELFDKLFGKIEGIEAKIDAKLPGLMGYTPPKDE